MRSMLIVDDQPDLRMLLRMTFAGSGFEIREAADGQAALAACQQAMPDIVLLDVMMPGLDGYEVCRRIKSDNRAAGTFVVLMTAGHQATEEARARAAGTFVVLMTAGHQATEEIRATAAGADLYVAKPFSPNELLRAVQAMAHAAPPAP